MIDAALTKAYNGVAESVATVIRDASPFAFCPRCIASKLTIDEREVRRALQFLACASAAFAVTTRVCHGCHTATSLVAVRTSSVPRW